MAAQRCHTVARRWVGEVRWMGSNDEPNLRLRMTPQELASELAIDPKRLRALARVLTGRAAIQLPVPDRNLDGAIEAIIARLGM